MSGLFKLNLADIGKGFLVAFLTALISAVYTLLQTGFPTLPQFLTCLGVGLTAAVGYLVKNLLTNSQGTFLGGKSAELTPPDKL